MTTRTIEHLELAAYELLAQAAGDRAIAAYGEPATAPRSSSSTARASAGGSPPSGSTRR